MGELFVLAIVTYFGIMFGVACISSAYRDGGVFGLFALTTCILIGCVIASGGGKSRGK